MSFLRPSRHSTILVRWRWYTFHRQVLSHQPDRNMPKHMLDGVPFVSRDGLSLPFRASRDDGVLGVLPAVGVATLLEVFVPIIPIRDRESILVG